MIRLLEKRGFAFCVALVVHAALVLALGNYRSPVWMESGAIASFLYDGHGFSIRPKSEQRLWDHEAKQHAARWAERGDPVPYSELHPTSLHSPGYPYLLYLSWKLLGKTPRTNLAVGLLQSLLISSLVFPMHWLTRRWFGKKAATWAMWVTCFAPLYTYYATRLLPVAVFITLHPWLLMQWLALKDRPSAGRAALAGVTTGVAALFQPMLLAILGIVGLGVFLAQLWSGAYRHALAMLAAPLLLVLVLTPWTIRNYRVHHRLIPVRFGSAAFWAGNNPHATGADVLEGGREDIYVAYPPKCLKDGTTMTELQVQNAIRHEALDYIRSDPGAFVLRTGKKILWFWTIAPKRYASRQNLAAAAKYRWVHIGYWSVYVFLVVLAFLAGRRFEREYVLVITLYVVLCSCLYGLLHTAQVRFRGEIEYIFVPAVAQGTALLWSRINLLMRRDASHS